MFKNFASQFEQGNKIDGFDFMFVAVHGESHITGGTEAGCNFLRTSGSYVPHSFLGYISSLQYSVGREWFVY